MVTRRFPTHSLKLAAVAAVLVHAAPGHAQTSVFAPPTGLQLSVNGGTPYGAAGAPNWTVTSFSSPSPFPTFIYNHTQNHAGYVTYHADGRFGFKASGWLLPCTALQNGVAQVVEYDLLADPPVIKTPTPLNTLHHAVLAGNVYYQPIGPFDAVCTTNMISVADSLILSNTVNGQVLFYQLKLGGSGVHGGVLITGTSAQPGWFEQGVNAQTGGKAQFGYDDVITAHGGAMVGSNASMNYDVDVLPTLINLITAGPPEPQNPIDHNLADWGIKEEYVSTAIWGHVASTVFWGDLSLNED